MSGNVLTKIVTDSLDSGNPILFFLTEDDERVYALIDDYFFRKEKEVLVYDPATGFSCDEDEQDGHTFVEIVGHWLDSKYLIGKQFILRDFHKDLEDIYTISALKQIIRSCKGTQIIIIDIVITVPRELEHFMSVIHVPLPDVNEIKDVLSNDLNTIPQIVEMSKGLEAIDIK